MTFIGTMLSFAVGLLCGIIWTATAAALRNSHPDMRLAYRHIALPAALVAGVVICVVSLIFEIRHYRQSKTLLGIARVSEKPHSGIAN